MGTVCNACRQACGKDRPLPFDAYACSPICELMLCDYLDGCGVNEMTELVEQLRADPVKLEAALKQRGIRP